MCPRPIAVVRLVERARIVLLAAAGKQDKDIAAELGITAQKAARWRKRFLALGMVGLEKDAPRPSRTPSISAGKVKRVIQKATQEKPAHRTHWSTRSMAAAVGLSEAAFRPIWHKNGLKPHLAETFKVSTDPHYTEKLEAVVVFI
jgi:transposase